MRAMQPTASNAPHVRTLCVVVLYVRVPIVPVPLLVLARHCLVCEKARELVDVVHRNHSPALCRLDPADDSVAVELVTQESQDKGVKHVRTVSTGASQSRPMRRR
jgi:hypothetical protein